jgi:hypothetical protein
MTWVRFDPDLGGADYPLHAGTCVDVLRGDLLHAATENAFDMCLGPPSNPGAATYYSTASMDAADWSVAELAVFPPVQIRPVAGAPDLRSVVVSVCCALSGAGTATVRVYLRAPRTAEGIDSDACYGSFSVASTTMAWKSATITVPEAGPTLATAFHPSDELSSVPPECDESQLVIRAICGTASRSLRVDGIRITEGAP